jgi:hypothetical protein
MDYILRGTFDTCEEALKLNDSGAARLGALAYADDVALVTATPDLAQRLLSKMEIAAKKVGLSININKTEYMFLPQAKPHLSLTVAGQTINTTSRFTYLGSEVADSRTAFLQRRAKAWAAASKLRKIFHSHTVKEVIKVLLFRATVESVLFYAAETLAVSPTFAKEVDRTHSALLRFALGIHWPTKITNTSLYERVKIPLASKTIRSRRLRLYGHLKRNWTSTPAGLLLHYPSQCKYRRGGHRRIVFERTIADDLRILGANEEDTLNRERWRQLCEEASL